VSVFDEALAVPAIVHSPVASTKALAIGKAAAALLVTAARYPFRELVYLGDDAPAGLQQGLRSSARVQIVPSARDLPRGWQADVIAVASPGLPDSVLLTARQLAHPGTVVVIAVDRYSAGGVAKRALAKLWRTVTPYREVLPTQTEPQLFLLASDLPISLKRPVPGWTRRVSDGYLPAMFRFPKDEYTALHSLPPTSPLTGTRP